MTASMMEVMDLTALHDQWALFLSTGKEAIDDSLASTLVSAFKPRKNVHFRYPLVTSCHYRPRETPEEIRKLFFSKHEMALFRLQRRAEIEHEAKEALYEQNDVRKPAISEFTPKFEIIDKGQSQVKVMYAVPKQKKKRVSAARVTMHRGSHEFV